MLFVEMKLISGKTDLKKQLMELVGNITKEVTNDVVKNTAVVSVNDLNKNIGQIKKNSEDIVKNIHTAETAYKKILSDNGSELKIVSENIYALNNAVSSLDQDVNTCRKNINNIVEKSIQNGTQKVTSMVIEKQIFPSITKFRDEIKVTEHRMEQLRKNVEEANNIQNITKHKLADVRKELDNKIQSLDNIVKDVNRNLEVFDNRQLQKNKELTKTIEQQLNKIKTEIDKLDGLLNNSNNAIAYKVNDINNSVFNLENNLTLSIEEKYNSLKQNDNNLMIKINELEMLVNSYAQSFNGKIYDINEDLMKQLKYMRFTLLFFAISVAVLIIFCIIYFKKI